MSRRVEDHLLGAPGRGAQLPPSGILLLKLATSTTSRETDAELIRRVATGDVQAFEGLYQRHHPRLIRFVRSLTKRADVAEEVANDTLVVAWQKAGDFQGRSRVSTWLMGIAYRMTMKQLRRLSRWWEDELSDEHVDPDDEGPDVAFARHEDREAIRRALEQLSPEHRAVVELTFFEDCSYKEIALVVGCPENTVKTRMFHARRRLRHLMAESTDRD
ncbi:MAG: sigma-70 family RNA polymerase sigma factor [Acidobacteriota bacterium]